MSRGFRILASTFGTETGDDACVFQLNDEQAVVETLDFFTPVVNDLYDFDFRPR